MFYWIISAALIASALASPYRNPPCNWAVLCSPSRIDTVSGNDLINMDTYHTIPITVSPEDNSKTEISTSTKTSSGNAGIDFSRIKDFIDYSSHTVTKSVPPTTTTTEAPKPRFSEAEMEMMFKSFTRYFKDYFYSVKAPSTTTTEAPEPQTNLDSRIDTKRMREYTNSFGNSQRNSGNFAGGEKFDSMVWKKLFANHPELLEEYLAYRKDYTVSHPNFGPSFKKAPEKPEPYDEETTQIAQNNKHLIPVVSPITNIAPPPASSQSTVIKTISGSRGVGHKLEHKSSKSSESSSSNIIQYTYGNTPTGYRMISGENWYKVPHTFSADLNQLTQIKKVPTFQQNPCEFSTGTYGFIPCDNLMSQETAVQKTIPIFKSTETYQFKNPFAFSDANNGFANNKAADC